MEWLNSVDMAIIDGPIAIRRYANRQLFSTETGPSATLENLAVVEEEAELAAFAVEAGAHATRSVLRQIIREQARHG